MKRILQGAIALTMVSTGIIGHADELVISETCNDLSINCYASEIKDAYKQMYPGAEDIIDEVVDSICADEQFIYIFETIGNSAFHIVEDSLNDIFQPRINTCMQTDDLYVSCYSFPNIKQNTSYNCGPACTTMTLIGGGTSGYYYTNNTTVTDQWQTNITTELGTTPNSNGTRVGMITEVLSEKIPSKNGCTYRSKAFTKNSYGLAFDFICDSLVNDGVPVILVNDTSLLPYYNGVSTGSGHYIVVEQVDFNAEVVQIVDPHYDDRYFGAHTLTFEEFNYFIRETAIPETSDLWMSVLTTSGSAPYIY